MGGNALKRKSIRLSKKDYLILTEEVIQKLNSLGLSPTTIPSVKDKEDFGDLDILLPKPKLHNLNTQLKVTFGSKEVVNNKDVISFEYKDFQVDLIHVSTADLQSAKIYYSYNDLGMLIGMIAKTLDCKYGHNGLFYEFHSCNRSYKHTFPIPASPRSIFNLFDLDYDTFLSGFESIEDVFKFVCSSKFFSKSSFLSDKKNHKKRKRAAKRKTWIQFLDYIKDLPDNNVTLPSNTLDYVSSFFPEANLKERVNNELNRIDELNYVKSKFNGFLVSELTNLEGKELGKFIASFKENYKDFNDFILNTDQYFINKAIRSHFEQLKGFYD